MKIKAGVIGVTGYTGEELVSILSRHNNVDIKLLTARTEKPTLVSDLFPKFKNVCDIAVENLDPAEAVKRLDVAFLALPHTVSMQFAPIFLKAGVKVIDLGADYRLDEANYTKWYKTAHSDAGNLKNAVYGLPEINRAAIKNALLIANPGCYPTATSLAILPALKNSIISGDIIVDAKSGTTGAGRKTNSPLLFSDVDEDFKAYKVNEHQHMPEMMTVLKNFSGKETKVHFVPHLLPIRRGILSCVYMRLAGDMNEDKIIEMYKDFYKNEPFVRVLNKGAFPEIKNVALTNFCDIGLKAKDGLLIAISGIDNLLKGASGQAVQNMNIMYGFDEKEGLI